LISESENEVDSGIPFIKDLPLIGHAARNKTSTTSRSELMIFIQPVVVDDNQEAVTISYDEDVRSDVGEAAAEVFPEPGTPTILHRAEVVRDAEAEDSPLEKLGQRLFGKKRPPRQPAPAE